MPCRSPEAVARKNAKKRASRAAEKMAALVSSAIPAGISKTHPSYRRRVPPVPYMDLPSDRRNFLRQAVLNTSGASA
jgi:hypothetical protein